MNRKSFLKKLVGAGAATVAVSAIPATVIEKEKKPEEVLEPVAFEDQEIETKSENSFAVVVTTKRKGVFYFKKNK